MVLDAARMLAASVHFCIALSIRLRRFAECEATLCAGSAASSNAAAECLLTVARDLKEIAERDERVLKDFQSSQEKVSTAAWWLLANLVVCTLLLTKSVGPFGFESGTLIFAFLNGCCILAKTYGLTFRNVSLASVGAYLTGQSQLALGACVFIVPMLLLNLLFWIVVHLFLSATADWWPGFLLQPVSWAAMERLSVLMVSWWLLWKTAMLVEILANHSYYRLVLARRRSSGIPTIAYHLFDSVYAYSYSILGFQLGWRVLQFCAYFVYLATPYSWSASGIMLMLGLRASVASFGQGAKAVMSHVRVPDSMTCLKTWDGLGMAGRRRMNRIIELCLLETDVTILRLATVRVQTPAEGVQARNGPFRGTGRCTAQCTSSLSTPAGTRTTQREMQQESQEVHLCACNLGMECPKAPFVYCGPSLGCMPMYTTLNAGFVGVPPGRLDLSLPSSPCTGLLL